jgi:ribosomal protein S27E
MLRQFSCADCGADVVWDPAAGAPRCGNCGATLEPPAATTDAALREQDFLTWARTSVGAEQLQEVLVVHCADCGGETAFGENVTAGSCAFCGSPIAAQAVSRKRIKPAALLPFRITRAQALERFMAWIGSRWFAPNALNRLAAADTQRLRGVYLPFWTYDADATTTYTGQRGDDYTVTETYTTQENGRAVTKTRQVTHTRWSSASGVVDDSFDDVLVCASGSVPADIVQKLEPWDMDALVPYADEYVAGFESESYRLDLAAGFEAAQKIMSQTIDQTIRADIGGDHQRVTSADTSYRDVRFKHLLLPLWLCAYRFRDRVFRFVVNARTGEVQGERPWSWIKITLLILVVAAAAAAIVYIQRQ